MNEFRDRCCRALRILHSQQFVRSELNDFGPFGMGKNIELLLPDCVEDHISDLEGSHACLHGGLECGQTGLHLWGHRDRFVTQLRGSMTLGVEDICPYKSWAEDRYFDERVPLLKRYVEAFGEGHHCVLRHRIRSGGTPDDESGGRRRIDDMAFRLL